MTYILRSSDLCDIVLHHHDHEFLRILNYHKISKFLDTRKLYCNLPKFQTKRPNLRVFHQKDADGIANSEDPDQTAPLGGAV